MELKRRLDPKTVFIGLYVVLFAIYIIVGLQPAGATNYPVSAELSIPAIELTSDVTSLQLENHALNTPDTIVGSYSQAEHKTLLIGHSTTVFEKLNEVELGDLIRFDDVDYRVTSINMVLKERIDMSEVLQGADKDTVIIMTCAGQLLDGGDATHRLMVTASI
ncbi:MAG: class F sortase [Candidatus Saccharibacteria bacterium]|nr:class F sortase [Candidatus Saccharibacteria bacterium]